MLALCASPHDFDATINSVPEGERARVEAFARDMDEQGRRTLSAFQTVYPTARVIKIPKANHYIFVSNEAEVLKEMKAFIFSLK